jgi:hypothetical protein
MAIKTLLHEFRMGDVDDIEIYVAEPIWQWQQTECGQWCMAHARNNHWLRDVDHTSFGWRISIVGELDDLDRTYFELKWGHRDKVVRG